MATTIRTDTIIPEVLEDAVRGEFEGVQALYGSGAAFVTGRGWPGARGGDTIKIPYFGTIGEFEDLAADEGAGGAIPALTPAKITMSSETATVQHSGKAIEVTEWAQLAAAYADPYAEAARQIRRGFERRIDLKLLTEAATTTLENDIYDPANAATGQLTWESLLDGRFLWGDEQEDIALAVMHSAVALDLLKQKDLDDQPLYAGTVEGAMIRLPGIGVPIRISDRATSTLDAGGGGTATAYETLILKRNSLALWFSGGENQEIQTDRDILSDTHIAALHTYYAAHRYTRMAGSTKTGIVKIRHNLAA